MDLVTLLAGSVTHYASTGTDLAMFGACIRSNYPEKVLRYELDVSMSLRGFAKSA